MPSASQQAFATATEVATLFAIHALSKPRVSTLHQQHVSDPFPATSGAAYRASAPSADANCFQAASHKMKYVVGKWLLQQVTLHPEHKSIPEEVVSGENDKEMINSTLQAFINILMVIALKGDSGLLMPTSSDICALDNEVSKRANRSRPRSGFTHQQMTGTEPPRTSEGEGARLSSGARQSLNNNATTIIPSASFNASDAAIAKQILRDLEDTIVSAAFNITNLYQRLYSTREFAYQLVPPLRVLSGNYGTTEDSDEEEGANQAAKQAQPQAGVYPPALPASSQTLLRQTAIPIDCQLSRFCRWVRVKWEASPHELRTSLLEEVQLWEKAFPSCLSASKALAQAELPSLMLAHGLSTKAARSSQNSARSSKRLSGIADGEGSSCSSRPSPTAASDPVKNNKEPANLSSVSFKPTLRDSVDFENQIFSCGPAAADRRHASAILLQSQMTLPAPKQALELSQPLASRASSDLMRLCNQHLQAGQPMAASSVADNIVKTTHHSVGGALVVAMAHLGSYAANLARGRWRAAAEEIATAMHAIRRYELIMLGTLLLNTPANAAADGSGSPFNKAGGEGGSLATTSALSQLRLCTQARVTALLALAELLSACPALAISKLKVLLVNILQEASEVLVGGGGTCVVAEAQTAISLSSANYFGLGANLRAHADASAAAPGSASGQQTIRSGGGSAISSSKVASSASLDANGATFQSSPTAAITALVRLARLLTAGIPRAKSFRSSILMLSNGILARSGGLYGVVPFDVSRHSSADMQSASNIVSLSSTSCETMRRVLRASTVCVPLARLFSGRHIVTGQSVSPSDLHRFLQTNGPISLGKAQASLMIENWVSMFTAESLREFQCCSTFTSTEALRAIQAVATALMSNAEPQKQQRLPFVSLSAVSQWSLRSIAFLSAALALENRGLLACASDLALAALSIWGLHKSLSFHPSAAAAASTTFGHLSAIEQTQQWLLLYGCGPIGSPSTKEDSDSGPNADGAATDDDLLSGEFGEELRQLGEYFEEIRLESASNAHLKSASTTTSNTTTNGSAAHSKALMSLLHGGNDDGGKTEYASAMLSSSEILRHTLSESNVVLTPTTVALITLALEIVARCNTRLLDRPHSCASTIVASQQQFAKASSIQSPNKVAYPRGPALSLFQSSEDYTSTNNREDEIGEPTVTPTSQPRACSNISTRIPRPTPSQLVSASASVLHQIGLGFHYPPALFASVTAKLRALSEVPHRTPSNYSAPAAVYCTQSAVNLMRAAETLLQIAEIGHMTNDTSTNGPIGELTLALLPLLWRNNSALVVFQKDLSSIGTSSLHLLPTTQIKTLSNVTSAYPLMNAVIEAKICFAFLRSASHTEGRSSQQLERLRNLLGSWRRSWVDAGWPFEGIWGRLGFDSVKYATFKPSNSCTLAEKVIVSARRLKEAAATSGPDAVAKHQRAVVKIARLASSRASCTSLTSSGINVDVGSLVTLCTTVERLVGTCVVEEDASQSL